MLPRNVSISVAFAAVNVAMARCPRAKESLRNLTISAFVVSSAGIFLAACRYLDAAASPIEIPLGLGSRHIAAAHITSATGAVAIVVSESSVVRLFCHGALIGEIIPELWMMKGYEIQVGGPIVRETAGDLAIVTSRPRWGAQSRTTRPVPPPA